MSILPILGRMRSRALALLFLAASCSITASRIFAMPVSAMNSGSWKGGFSMPTLPVRYLRMWHQCRGTGTLQR